MLSVLNAECAESLSGMYLLSSVNGVLQLQRRDDAEVCGRRVGQDRRDGRYIYWDGAGSGEENYVHVW